MTSRPKVQAITAILAISLFAGCGSGMVQGGRVAMVNNEAISQKEFQESYDQVVKMMNIDPSMLKEDTYASMQKMFQKITMQNLILTHLVEQEAHKRNISVTPQEVEEAYNKQLAQVGGEKAMKAQLEEVGMTKAGFQKELKKQIMMDKLVQIIAADQIRVSEKDALAFYKSNENQFHQPEQVRARHILVNADPNQIKNDLKQLKQGAKPEEIEAQVKATMADKRKKAEQLYAEVKAHPEKFESIAKVNSDDQGSAKKGGDLGYFAREAMVPSFSNAAFSTKPGQIHEGIVESQFGYHIIQVVDRKPAEKKSFEDVKDRIITYLENQRKSKVMQDWLENEKKKAKIVIEPEYDFEKQESSQLIPLNPAETKQDSKKPKADKH